MRRIGRDSPFIETAHAYRRPDYAIQGYEGASVNSKVVRVSESQCERGDRPGTPRKFISIDRSIGDRGGARDSSTRHELRLQSYDEDVESVTDS